MQIGINTKTYGTTGLPKFGASFVEPSRAGQIKEYDGAINQFMDIVKGLTAPGNEIALAKFSTALEGLYWLGANCVQGKPVVNN